MNAGTGSPQSDREDVALFASCTCDCLCGECHGCGRGPIAVTGKQCQNVAPGLATVSYAGLRCVKMSGHRGLCKVSPDGSHWFSWNAELVQ